MEVLNLNYCVIRDTVKVIDGSTNPKETMVLNAKNAGFKENEVEILTKEEYQARLELEPKPIQKPTTNERLQALEEMELERLLGGMLNG